MVISWNKDGRLRRKSKLCQDLLEKGGLPSLPTSEKWYSVLKFAFASCSVPRQCCHQHWRGSMSVPFASRLVTQISLSGEEGVEGDYVVKQTLWTSFCVLSEVQSFRVFTMVISSWVPFSTFRMQRIRSSVFRHQPASSVRGFHIMRSFWIICCPYLISCAEDFIANAHDESVFEPLSFKLLWPACHSQLGSGGGGISKYNNQQ